MYYAAASIFDPIADAYDGWYDTPEGHSIFRDEVRCLRQLRDDYSGRWLEVGLDTGRLATALGITHGIDLRSGDLSGYFLRVIDLVVKPNQLVNACL